MEEVCFSMHAVMYLEGKYNNGIASFDERSLLFTNLSGAILFNEEVHWGKVNYTITIEKIQRFWIFSSKKIALAVVDDQRTLPKLFFEVEQREIIEEKVGMLYEYAHSLIEKNKQAGHIKDNTQEALLCPKKNLVFHPLRIKLQIVLHRLIRMQ